MKKLWIAWEDDTSIRSRVLASELRAEYRAFTLFTRSKIFKWLRYPVAMVQTAWAMAHQRPELLVVQNPSILLAFEAALLSQMLGLRLVIDLHTPYNNPTGIIRVVADFLNGSSQNHIQVMRDMDGEVATRHLHQHLARLKHS